MINKLRETKTNVPTTMGNDLFLDITIKTKRECPGATELEEIRREFVDTMSFFRRHCHIGMCHTEGSKKIWDAFFICVWGKDLKRFEKIMKKNPEISQLADGIEGADARLVKIVKKMAMINFHLRKMEVVVNSCSLRADMPSEDIDSWILEQHKPYDDGVKKQLFGVSMCECPVIKFREV